MRCAGSLVRLVQPVFMGAKAGQHPACFIEKEEIGVATEQFRDQRHRSASTCQIKTDDSVAGDVMQAIDARALNPSPEELAERRRAWRIGKCALHEVHAGGAVVHGTEQPARMARNTNVEQEAVRQRLGDFLDPAFA